MCFMSPFSRDTVNPVTTLQSELEEGHRCPRAGENRQAEHPFPAHWLPFLQLRCRHRRQDRAGGTLAAGLAEPSVVCLKPSIAIDRTTFPESPLTVVSSSPWTPGEYFQGIGKPCLSFCWGLGPVLALWNFALTLVFPGSSCPLFTDLPQQDSQERDCSVSTGKGKQGWSPGYCCWFPHVWEVQGCGAISNSFSTLQPWGVQKDSLSHRGWACGTWGPDHVALDGCISDILPLRCVFSGAKGGHFPRPTSTQV